VRERDEAQLLLLAEQAVKTQPDTPPAGWADEMAASLVAADVNDQLRECIAVLEADLAAAKAPTREMHRKMAEDAHAAIDGEVQELQADLARVTDELAEAKRGLLALCDAVSPGGADVDFVQRATLTRQLEVLHRDAMTFNDGLTADFAFVNYDGHHNPKGELFGEGELKEYSIYDPQTLALDDGVVMLSYNAIVSQKITDDDQHIPRYQHVTTIWVKQGADWKEKFHQTAALQVGS
jgi:hypothetical protein